MGNRKTFTGIVVSDKMQKTIVVSTEHTTKHQKYGRIVRKSNKFKAHDEKQAAKIGDLFVTLTGDINVIDGPHFGLMKDGAIVANSGHFNVEIDLDALKKIAKKINRGVRQYVDEFVLPSGRRV